MIRLSRVKTQIWKTQVINTIFSRIWAFVNFVPHIKDPSLTFSISFQIGVPDVDTLIGGHDWCSKFQKYLRSLKPPLTVEEDMLGFLVMTEIILVRNAQQLKGPKNTGARWILRMEWQLLLEGFLNIFSPN